MRKSNHVFSDPANGGILNLNQLQSKSFGSSLNIGSLLVPNSLCCGSIDDFYAIKDSEILTPATRPTATLSPGGGLQPVSSFKDFKEFDFKKFI